MPELAPQSTAALTPPPPSPPADLEDDDDLEIAAGPPVIDPPAWENFAVFRETFLAYFTRPKHAAALRVVGEMLFEMTLASWGEWPDQPEGFLRGQLRAVVADLRHLEGFLVTLTEAPSPDPYEGALHRTAMNMSRKLAAVAEHIEGKLGTWRGEVE